MATYKRLLIRHEVEACGNCDVVGNTGILEVVTDSLSSKNINTDIVDMTIIRRYDLVLEQPVQSENSK